MSVWFYTNEGNAGPFVFDGSALVGDASANIYTNTVSMENKAGYTDADIIEYASKAYASTPEEDRYDSYTIWVLHNNAKWDEIADLSTYAIQPGDEIRYHVVPEAAHTVTYTAGEHGTGNAYTDPSSHYANDSVDLKSFSDTGFLANPGWRFDHWQRDSKAAENPFDMPRSDVELTAVYVPDSAQTYNVTYETDGNGTVSPAVNNGIQVLGTDGVTGSTATANKTYRFEGWYVGDNKVLGATEELTADKAKEYINKNMKDDAWDGTYANTTFTAKFEVANTSIAVTKVWSDGTGGTPSITPEIKVNLLRNGEVFKEATIASGDTSYIFTDVPRKDADLNPYTYEVVEAQIGKTPVPADATSVQADIDGVEGKVNYEIAYSGDAGKGFVITNTMTSVLLTISNTVVDETIDSDNGLAQTFNMSLGGAYANGESKTFAVKKGGKYTVKSDANQTTWKTVYSINNGKAFDGANAGQITIAEDTTVAFTNTRVPLKYSVNKQWYLDEGMTPPASLDFKVIQATQITTNFSESDGKTVYEGTLSGFSAPTQNPIAPEVYVSDTTQMIPLLPYASLEGARYFYNTHEESSDKYAEEGNGWTGWTAPQGPKGEDGILAFIGMLNNYYNVTSLSGTKKWIDPGETTHNNAEEVTLSLQRRSLDNGLVWENVEGVAPTWNGDTYTFNNLPKYDVAPHGWDYKVVETSVAEGYVALGEGTAANGYTITNQKIQSLVITANDGTWDYNGQAHAKDGYTLTIDGGAPISVGADGVYAFSNGDVLTVDVQGSITDAGTVENRIASYTIKNNGSDKTSAYSVAPNNGTLTVNKLAVTVTANDQEKMYGEDNPALTYEVEGLLEGETLDGIGAVQIPTTAATKNSPVNAEGYPITFENEVAFTTNYDITYKPGKLTIRPYATPITITAQDAARDYNGEALTQPGFKVAGVLVAGDKVVDVAMTPDSTITNAGEQANVIDTFKIVNGNGDDVTNNYANIIEVAGKLTVNKLDVTVTAEDKEKIYGEENPELTYAAEGLIAGETLEGIGATPTLATEATATSPVKEGGYAIDFNEPVASAANYKHHVQAGHPDYHRH